MLRPAFAAVLLAVLALASAADAFGSDAGGPHDDVTRSAARLAGFPESGADALVAATRAPDSEDSGPRVGVDGVHTEKTDSYRPEHHCDRVPPATDAEAFNATVAYVRQQGESARNASLAREPEEAVRSLGRALHALEDCFAHTNAVDLEEPTAVVHAVVGQVPPPDGLRVTGADPNGTDPGRPPGDDYSHADFAKDGPDTSHESRLVLADNRTKFEAARDLATDAAALFLQDWMAGVNAAELGPIGEVDAPGGGLVPRWAPGPAPLAVAFAVVAAIALTLHRRR